MNARISRLASAFLLLAILLAGCRPAVPTPTPPPTRAAAATAAPTSAPTAPPTAAPATVAPTVAPRYSEAPVLTERVKKNELPPVEQRLPEEPLVVPPVEEIGQYGGTWRRAWKGPADIHAYARLNYDPVLRWPRNLKDPIQPGLAKKWEFSPDGTTLTLYFRKGLRWSDGQPWTVDDILFWWEAIETDREVTTAIHQEFVVNGKPMALEKIDDYTIRLKFDGPNGLIVPLLAFHGVQWPLSFERFGFFAPAHYLKQFHPKYNKEVKDYKLFNEKADDLNPERPVMSAWVISQDKPGTTKLIATRNPYYWKVDPKGQQLPYIDEIELTLMENNDAIAAKALACEIDMQFRNMDLKKFPLFKENEKKCDYRVLRWESANGTMLGFWPNLSYAEDPVLLLIFQDKNFRIALSYAIDRNKINAVAYLGQAVIRSSKVTPDSPYYQPETDKLYIEYDPKRAAEYLDKAGLKMGPDGKVRLRPDGKPLEITIETERTGAELDAVQLVAADWNAVGVKTAIKTESRELFNTRVYGNQVQVAVWQTGRGVQPLVDPLAIFPFDQRSYMAPAFGTYYATGGAKGEKPTARVMEAQQLYDQFRVTVDPEKQLQIGKQIIKISDEEVWTIMTVGLAPVPTIVKNNFRNVPATGTDDFTVMSPGYADPCQFFFKK